jgi:hypothetical protein
MSGQWGFQWILYFEHVSSCDIAWKSLSLQDTWHVLAGFGEVCFLSVYIQLWEIGDFSLNMYFCIILVVMPLGLEKMNISFCFEGVMWIKEVRVSFEIFMGVVIIFYSWKRQETQCNEPKWHPTSHFNVLRVIAVAIFHLGNLWILLALCVTPAF